MTKTRSLIIDSLVILAVSLLNQGCCKYPHRALTRVCRTPPEKSISIVAYGDTRTGPWGLGDNCDQAIHAMVMDDILRTNEGIDAVIFTGDAVMTNFPLWKKLYWQAFLSQSDRIVKTAQSPGPAPCIPFLPTMGNHETYNLIPGAAPQKPGRRPSSTGEAPASVSEAYDRGEKSAAIQGAVPVSESIDYNSAAGQKQLLKWEKLLKKGNQKEKVEAAMGLGAFEGQLQSDFHRLSLAKLRSEIDGQLFKDAYIDIAKYGYLGPYIQPSGSDGPRAFYSYTVNRNGIAVKLIALDTNCLDFLDQLHFFEDEVSHFNGPIIVFGHHPPVTEETTGVLPWDVTRGWEQYKPYIETDKGKNIRLWVFGHVHNYQRRNPPTPHDAPKGQASAPVVLISGGGGAADLNDTAGPNQWQPASWADPIINKQFNYARISVTKDSIAVTVYGKPSLREPFSKIPIDSFTIDLNR